MAKRSQRPALRYEKDRAGCIWGLISIFDFRHGRTTRKLLSDRKRGSKPAVGSACSSSTQAVPDPIDNRLNIEDNEESEVAVPDPKTSVKELMEEEMVNEQSLKNPGNGSEIDVGEFNSQKSWRARKNSRRTRRPSNTYFHDLDDDGNLRSEAPYHQDSRGKALDDVDIVMEELRQIHQKSRKFVKVRQDLHNDHNKQSDQTQPVVEEKLNAAIEVFINQRSRNNKQLGEDNKTLQSKEFMDALQTLSSNKEFILTLLQDPNSRLLKQIGSLEDAQFEEKQKPNLIPESNMSMENRVHAKTDDVINHKQRKFFRRRSKSQEIYPPMEDETPRPSSKIVILKPGPGGLQSPSAQTNVNTPVHSQYAEKRTMQGERNTSQFSFTEIKRKLKHAMGKDRHGISQEGTIRRFPSEQLKWSNSERISGENLGWSSPNRDHFYTEKFAKSPLGIKRGDKIVKSKGVEAVSPTEASDFPRPGMPNIYIEAKKHLVEMLDNEDETTTVSSGQLPKSLGRILSFPEYNSSPGCSPRENSKDSMLPSQIREPITDPIQGTNDDRLQHVRDDHVTGPSPSTQDLEIESSCSDKYPNECTNVEVPHGNVNTVDEDVASTGHKSPKGDLTEETKTKGLEEGEVLSALSELDSSPIDRDIRIDGDATNAVDDGSSAQGFELSFDCLQEDPSREDQTLSSLPVSPARSSSPRKAEDPNSVVDRMERPSPVSVLEPLFVEDDVSPSSTICRPVDPEIQPRKIHFEEPVSSISEQVCPTVCFENEESAFEYVEAVLLGSGLNWDDLLLRWLSSDQVLDPSLFDEVELFSSRSSHDQKLLFDCANEVLKAVCDRYFGCHPGVSLGKHNIRPVPKGMDLINEVWEGVEWYLLQYSTPHSLDQLVKKDMERSGTWMDLRLDLGHIGVEMEEIILEELVEDTILSISSDTLECEDVTSQPRMKLTVAWTSDLSLSLSVGTKRRLP